MMMVMIYCSYYWFEQVDIKIFLSTECSFTRTAMLLCSECSYYSLCITSFSPVLYMATLQNLRFLHHLAVLKYQVAMYSRLRCSLTVTHKIKSMDFHWHWVQDIEMPLLFFSDITTQFASDSVHVWNRFYNISVHSLFLTFPQKHT